MKMKVLYWLGMTLAAVACAAWLYLLLVFVLLFGGV